MARSDLTIRFWGVRGSIACPGADTARYGGNTSCVEVRCGERLLIFDAGTGLRALGHTLVNRRRPIDLDLFFSHTHFDHVVGLPFFAPCYEARSQMRFWAGHLKRGGGIETVLGKTMAAPLFPIPLNIFAAQIDFIDFVAGGTPLVPHPGVVLHTAPLNHPNGATGYRLEYRGKSVAYITDTEHLAGHHDPNVMNLIRNVDVMIYDCTYTDDEYLNHRSWGHSTWQEGVRLANAGQAGKLVIFHHDPDHNDAFMDRVAVAAEAERPGTVVAQEGLVLTP